MAFALKSHSVRVVFTSADSLAMVGRGFVLIYQALSPGKRLTKPSLLCLALPCLIFFNYVFFSNADTCIKYYNARPGIEERISSAKTRCRHAVISQKSTWQRLWFKSINIPSGNFILVTLKSPSGNKMSWNLTSNDTIVM